MMTSIQQQRLADRQAHLARVRRTYLRMVAIELGTPHADIRELALREIGEMAALVKEADDAMADALRRAAAE